MTKYDVEELVPPSPYDWSQAADVNMQHQVAGSIMLGGSATGVRAAIWDGGGVPVETFGFGIMSEAEAINASGKVTGNYGVIGPSLFYPIMPKHGFLHQGGTTTTTDLAPASKHAFGAALDMNDAGPTNASVAKR